ncbi:MAG: pilus assembly protein PilP [Gammaproteobacteria bacterium]|nr:pilus assembly protein PilP [Gammaproteobacteria bacterium]
MPRVIATGLATVLMTTLFGCAQQEYSDLHQYVNEVKSRPPVALKPLPEMQAVIAYEFIPEGLRNPFAPFKAEVDAVDMPLYSGVRPDASRPKEELETFALDSLRMTGTLEQNNVVWALVRDTENKIHRVSAGNYMGQNDGRILRVTEDKVELIEIVPDGPGAWREQQAFLVLAG